MKFATPADVLKALNIASFAEMTASKVQDVASLLPEIAPEVALSVVARIPDFAGLASAAIADLKSAYESTVAAQTSRQAQVMDLFRVELESLSSQLASGLTAEERVDILDRMREIRLKAIEVHTDGREAGERLHAHWVDGALKVAAGFLTVVLAVVVGSRVSTRS